VKRQKLKILNGTESQHSIRLDVILLTAHFFKQLPTQIAHIAKAHQANVETKALSKSAISYLKTTEL
jgi:hypothetical protein